MIDPFVTALAKLHASVGAVTAVYRPIGGVARDIRVIVDRRTADADAGTTHVRLRAALFQVQRIDVDAPVVGDQIGIGDETFELLEEMPPPSLDAEGITWTIEAPPAS